MSNERVKEEIEKDGLEYTFRDYINPKKDLEDETLSKLAVDFIKAADAIYKHLKMRR